MNILVKFDIYAFEPTNHAHGGSVYVTSPELYFEIWKVSAESWKKNTWPPGDKRSHIYVAADPNDSRLTRVYELLEKAGWRPYLGRTVPLELRNDHFLVWYARQYTSEDFDEADLLWIDKWGEETIATVNGKQNDRWVGRAQSGCWDARIGMMGGGNNYFVDDELRSDLERAALTRLLFHPLEWDNPLLAQAEFWELDSTLSMPSCLLPTIQAVTANMLDGTQQFGTFYDDRCYRPLELVFHRSQVEAIGEFDIARTREDLIWTRPDVGRHMLVVSQRFRRTLMDLGVDEVSYGIVRLVSDEWQRTGDAELLRDLKA